MDRDIATAERLAVLELKVEQLCREQTQMLEKLEDLLVLRSKGMGAFWVASSLLGTGILGLAWAFINYFRG